MRNRVAATLAATATCLGFAVLGASVVTLRDDALRPTRVRVEPVWVPIQSAPATLSEPRKFVVTRSSRVELPAPQWEGTITGVSLSPGDVLDGNLAAPLAVDGRDRPWLVAPIPLFRSVGLGAAGVDVDSLAAFLISSGQRFDHATGTPVDTAMVAAIRQWARWLGFGRAVSAFEPEWVTWLPDTAVGQRVATVDVSVGQLAPGHGAKFATIGAQPVSIAPASDVVVSSGARLQLDSATQVLVVGGVELGFDEGQLQSAALAELSRLLCPDRNDLTADVVQRLPPESQTVPARALMPSSSGFCAIVADAATGDRPRVTEVAVLGSIGGAAIVAPLGGFVLVNPATSDLMCS